MKNKKIKWLMVIAWMILIFTFSSQPGDTSEETSQFVIYIFNLLGLDLHGYFGALADFAVRKGAHFTEYLILYMLFYNALSESLNFKKALWFSMVAVFLYACSDEFHQSFVPGRGPAFRDVLIDSSGGFSGLIIIFMKNLISKNRKLTA
ncbi:VanZ family protein [Clostridium swellfunianum]|uniref:VanZ family protein n=1 Tax=Clostridium swellfunianum TaxID=1367462 RepID=UPI00203084F8|nr:VanZ family protein [Clostridium swellfunianum]MCM0648232.1 VanZ family protein [Clostridium swellfunianum]